jgi:uncharacterized protein YkwD
MSKPVLFRTALLAAVTAAVALPAPAAASTSAAPRLVAADSLEAAVVRKVNAARKARGLRALVSRRPLKRAATNHARDMASHGYFSHDWSNGAPFSQWIRRYWPGRNYRGSWSVGENLYWRGPTITAKQVIRAWLNSPPHRRNLLARKWRAIGVGAIEMIDPIGAYAGPSRATVVAAEFGFKN